MEEVENAKQRLKVETDNSKHLNCNHLWDHPIRQTTPNPNPHSCALRDDILLKWLSHLLYLHILLLSFSSSSLGVTDLREASVKVIWPVQLFETSHEEAPVPVSLECCLL